MDQTPVLQWNSQSLTRKKSELVHLISKFSPSVIAVSETWFRPGTRFRVSGYSCLRDDRADGHAGSALLVRRSLSFSQIPIPSHSPDINIVAIRALNISFISLYMPHPHSSLFPDILLVISSVPSIILMGDFNAHHRSWGCYRDDSFGHLLLEILDEANLCVINDGSPTRRVYPNQNPKSAVDLTICSPSLSSGLSWNILDSTYGSDHFPIIINLPSKASPVQNFSPSLKYKLIDVGPVDWSLYSSDLDSKIDNFNLPTLSNSLECYSQFVNNITSCADDHFPLKKPHKFKVSTPWWDLECSSAIRERSFLSLIALE